MNDLTVDTSNAPDPMDLLDDNDGYRDGITIVCRMVRGSELATDPFVAAEFQTDGRIWDDLSFEEQDAYRELALNVMIDDYDHESPQPMSVELRRLRLLTVFLNF